MQCHLVPCLRDNYSFIIVNGQNHALVIDPADSGTVADFLKTHDLQLDYILNTHHHADHIGGNVALKQQYNCQIVAAAHDAHRIPGIDIHHIAGESFVWSGHEFYMLAVPGHTLGHVAWYQPEQKWLFIGDTLFVMGCGRLFEGTPEQMWQSLQDILRLPPETTVFCAHEYSLYNADFALSLLPDDEIFLARHAELTRLRQNGKATVPTTLLVERQTNPFLRCLDKDYRQKLTNHTGKNLTDIVSAFTYVRQQRDSF